MACLERKPTGVYVDPASLKSHLSDKYGSEDPEELKEDEEFYDDVMGNDVGLTVRLVIVYGSLKIGSVRGAFEESVGSRIKKFGGAANSDLLKRSSPPAQPPLSLSFMNIEALFLPFFTTCAHDSEFLWC